MYTIITENDISNWKDETGARYHFPNKYLKILKPGTKVIYYKGRLTDNSFKKDRKLNTPHYFGTAIIGEIYSDTNNKRNYFAEIENYKEFDKGINFKNSQGDYLEPVQGVNYWRNGVRKINKEIYESILSDKSIRNDNPVKQIESPKERKIELSENELLIIKPSDKNKNSVSDPSVKYSKNAKKVGDIGEKIVLEYLESVLTESEKKTLKWLANLGETPGYDIEYENDLEQKIRIEVKATTAKKFPYFNLTINELNSAKQFDNYYIYLVSECLTENPKIEIVENPFKGESVNKFSVEPIAFKVYKTK
ncbi:MAG: DUF3883 domain-containing protein [Bacteroidales bacterium]|nr:DUF3883 domain-containing protein [Bacteroidales bacterium]